MLHADMRQMDNFQCGVFPLGEHQASDVPAEVLAQRSCMESFRTFNLT